MSSLTAELAPTRLLPRFRARADAAPAATQPEPRAELDDLLRATLARPLFSATRRPPQTAGNAAADPDLTDTRLTGIVTEPDRRLAIFAVTGGKPVVLTEGETVSGWRIDSISPREVSVSGPSGTKILQPRIDQNAVAQPLSPPAGASRRAGGRSIRAARPGAAPVPGAPTATRRSIASPGFSPVSPTGTNGSTAMMMLRRISRSLGFFLSSCRSLPAARRSRRSA